MRKSPSLFDDYPIDGEVMVSGELLPTPYQIYDGTMWMIGGTVDLDEAQRRLSHAGLQPLCDDSGKALAAMWVCDFKDANLGPHHELQLSLFSTKDASQIVQSHPFALLRALTLDPQIRMICHGLWNNRQRVVDYNNQHLQLNAERASSIVERTRGELSFHFSDTGSEVIAAGRLNVAHHTSMVDAYQLAHLIGIRVMYRHARLPNVHIPVVSLHSEFPHGNVISDTYSHGAKQTIRRTNARDNLIIRHPNFVKLGFEPAFIQQISGVEFVFLRPQPLSEKISN